MSLPRRTRVLPAVLLALLLSLVIPSCDRSPAPTPPPETPPATAPTAPADESPVPPPTTLPIPTVTPGTETARTGDEIMVAGRLFRTGTRVVLWTDPNGYDAYRTERRFSAWAEAPFTPTTGKALDGQPRLPARLGIRDAVLNWTQLEQVRGGGWPLPLLQQKIDQFVLHYDVVGASKFCFKTLHDDRGLSVHFLLDIDGTIYQTMDLKDRAFHATTSNYRSVGIEIANRGAYESEVPLKEFYTRDAQGTRISLPARFGDGGLLVPGVYRPARDGLVRGTINNVRLAMYDFTPEQYEALTRLTATLCTVLPRITLAYPKDSAGNVVPRKLPDTTLDRYQGLIAHYHIQSEKYDPGPAFQWERIVRGAEALMSPAALAQNQRLKNSPVRPGPITAPSAR